MIASLTDLRHDSRVSLALDKARDNAAFAVPELSKVCLISASIASVSAKADLLASNASLAATRLSS